MRTAMTTGTNPRSHARIATAATRPEGRHPPRTVSELLASSIRADPSKPAILAPGREPLTFAGLARQLETATRSLAAAGYGRGSRIAVVLPQGPECAVAVLAVLASATCAPLNPDLGEDALLELLVAMRIDAVISPVGVDSPVTRAARRAGVAAVGFRPTPAAPCGTFELIAPLYDVDAVPEAPRLEDVAVLAHTSGTTAKPKIVPHTHRIIAEAARTRAELGRLTRADRSLLLLPMHNLSSIRRVLLPPLVEGGSVVCVSRFDPAHFFDWLEQFEPTYFMASAATHMTILEALELRGQAVAHSLRFTLSGGAALPVGVQMQLERALGAAVIQGYGITETGNIAQTPLPPERAPPGSVGRPTIDLAIMDETGIAVGAEEIGEIVVRGPEIFDGYEGDSVATAAAFRDGWFRTGDLGRLDHEGFLFIVGRVSDIINRGGAKVAPAEVDAALQKHPQVAQAAAFALPHPTLGEDVAAVVVLRDGGDASETELRDFSRSQLTAFKVPTRILVVPELPRGAFDKVKRGALAAMALEWLQAEFVPPRDGDEAEVATIFGEVLGLDRVGAHDNFFQQGGDSLRAMRAVARIQSRFAVPIGVEALFRRPTAAGLAQEILAARDSGSSLEPPPLAPLRRPI